MKKTLLFVLTLSGLAALSTNPIREYHYVKKLKNWAEAQSYCRKEFTDLATVDSQEDNDRLLSVLDSSTNNAWIGLYDGLNLWKWVLGNTDLNNEFNNWEENNPVKDFKMRCTSMTQEGLWLNSLCHIKRPAVCYYERGPSKYILVQKKMTWSRARTYCMSNYTDLVSVRNITENDAISSLLFNNSVNTWIGLHRRTWPYWSDQTPRGHYNNWNKNQPHRETTKACVMTEKANKAKWLKVDCKARNHFICQTVSYPPHQHKTTFKFKFQSEADLNDPAVQQQILEQLHAKLEKNGLSDFKLRWTQKEGQTFHKEKEKNKEESSCTNTGNT